MIGVDEVHLLYTTLRDHALAGRWSDASAILARLEGWSADDLNGGELAELWWTFCEPLADALASSDPSAARRLYDLARTSFEKEGSQATGAGEGMRAMADVARVAKKRAALRA
jgi:hypothetical protein